MIQDEQSRVEQSRDSGYTGSPSLVEAATAPGRGVHPMTEPWRGVAIEDIDTGNIGIEMRPGSDHLWLVFYGRRGGRTYTRPLDRKRVEALSLRLRQAAAAMGSTR